VRVESTDVTFEWQSPEEFTIFIKEVAPPVTSMISGHPQAVQDDTWAATTEAVRAASGGGSPLRLSNVALVAGGRA
jgi:hypothetical protein